MNGTTFFVTIYNLLPTQEPVRPAASFMLCHGQTNAILQIVRATLFDKECFKTHVCTDRDFKNYEEMTMEMYKIGAAVPSSGAYISECLGQFYSNDTLLLRDIICPWLKDVSPPSNFIYDCMSYATHALKKNCTNIQTGSGHYCYDIMSKTATAVSVKMRAHLDGYCIPDISSISEKVLDITAKTTAKIVHHFNHSLILERHDSNVKYECNEAPIHTASLETVDKTESWTIVAIIISFIALTCFAGSIYVIYRRWTRSSGETAPLLHRRAINTNKGSGET